MIKLINGNVQGAGGVVVPNGSITLQLTQDAALIASPGQVVSAIPITFKFDSSGNLLGSCQVWSNAELTPQTQYTVTFYDQSGARLTQPVFWQFTQAAGTTVDIGTMVPTPGGISFSTPFSQIGQLALVTFSATPVFSALSVSGFKIILTGNVSSSTFVNGIAGGYYTFVIVQDASGGRTFAWPPNVKNPQTIDPTPNAINVQTFYFDGTNAYPIGPMTVN